jgi:two-component system, NtrC family, sensor histidine kinase KinB
MASHDVRRRLGLRPRFLIATALLVLTAVLASVWTLGALSRLGAAVGETVRQNDEATKATAQVAGALEREDDALLLVLTGDTTARGQLTIERAQVDQQFATLDAVLNEPPEQELVDGLRAAIDAYRGAADRIADETPGSLIRYHRDVNPLLRRAVVFTVRLRDRHFESTRSMANQAHEEVVRARSIALAISLAALLVSVLLALHLARLVIVPLTDMTRRVQAMTRENFEERLTVTSRDELGDLAIAFNEMAEHLSEFRRSNLGETLRAKATLEATLQALPDAVILMDEEGRIVSMNRRAREVIHDSSGDDQHADALTVGGVALGTLVETAGRPSDPNPVDLARALRVDLDGSPRKLLARALPVADSNEEQRGKVLVLYDVTDLARLDEMRGELIAVASHELRTPLTTLRMTLLMLQESGASLPPREQELVATCVSGVQRLADTIDEFLDLTRIEAGHLRLNIDPVDLRALLEDAANRWRAEAAEHHVSLVVRAEANSLIDGDAARLRVVLDNLLSNAVKYAPDGSLIRLAASVGSTELGSQKVRVAVTDAGRGVPVEFRQRIFNKFFRVEQHRPGSDEGTRGVGIGLYLCRQIVSLHGGAIRCEEGDGHVGTRISFELPEHRPARG